MKFAHIPLIGKIAPVESSMTAISPASAPAPSLNAPKNTAKKAKKAAIAVNINFGKVFNLILAPFVRCFKQFTTKARFCKKYHVVRKPRGTKKERYTLKY
jgi:hypothetical protein